MRCIYLHKKCRSDPCDKPISSHSSYGLFCKKHRYYEKRHCAKKILKIFHQRLKKYEKFLDHQKKREEEEDEQEEDESSNSTDEGNEELIKCLASMSIAPMEPLTVALINERYRKMALKVHPDVSKDNGIKMQELNQSKELLLKMVSESKSNEG